jgi:dTDP-4-dehydrorhamnose reductase
VTGASGLLGAHLVAVFSRDHAVTGIDRHPWWGDQEASFLLGDLSDGVFLQESMKAVEPEVVIHCAAMVNVDACEDDPERAYACNSDLTGEIVRAAPDGCLTVYMTTDGVFPGAMPLMTEKDLPCPRTVYGKSKLHGEWSVQLASRDHLVIRTNFFGWSSGRKKSFAEWLYQALEEEQPVTLFDDFFFNPIYVSDLAERLVLLVDGGHRGLFHLGGKDRISKYRFGELLAAEAGLSMQAVTRGSIENARLRAPRPKDMSLSSAHFETVAGVEVPGCSDGLRRFVEERGRSLAHRLDSRQPVTLKSSSPE